MKRKNWYLFFWLSFIGQLLFFFLNCSGYNSTQQSKNSGSEAGPENGPEGNIPGEPPKNQGGLVISKSLSSVSAELGSYSQVLFTISSVNFSGNLDLIAEAPEIESLDAGNEFEVSISEEKLMLSPGQTVQVQLRLVVGAKAPSFSDQHVHVKFYKGDTQLLVAEEEVKLAIEPIFRIQIFGKGDANWLVGAQAISSYFNSSLNARGIEFLHHDKGLKVVIENYDLLPHRIQSSGPLPHQSSDMSPSGDGNQVGGIYQPSAIAGSSPSSSGIYLHGEESGGDARILYFDSNL
ncbi:MAG: hypothetical protein KDD35_00380 [Bdellovibrionales bacterium]|nr:hypothetical protein [Bdellovibrionales bacterium]